jgi:hypothetical protein
MESLFNFKDKELAEYIDLSPKAFSELKRKYPNRYELYRFGYVLKKYKFSQAQIEKIIALKDSFLPTELKEETKVLDRDAIEDMVIRGIPLGRISKQTGISIEELRSKLEEWGGEAYFKYRWNAARGRLINIRNIFIKDERYKRNLERQRKWGGADTGITDKEIPNTSKTVVVTDHYKELSWLFYKLRDAFTGLIDYIDKYVFYERLAKRAQSYLDSNPDCDPKDLLYDVLDEANDIHKEMKTGEFYQGNFEQVAIKLHSEE